MSALTSAVFKNLKQPLGSVIRNIDDFLITHNEESDRAINVNAPSQIGKCLRERYYGRVGAERDGMAVSPRSQRIFDNGTHVHLRLQEYLTEQGMLLIDEVPVLSAKYAIQGHTDGILRLSLSELGILEIKSINLNNFNSLKDIKPDHKKQGLVYAYCIEERRKYLHKTYKTFEDFKRGKLKRRKEIEPFYQHLKDGNKFTAKEKLSFQLALHEKLDTILYNTSKPVDKIVFLYECKDNQELKEFYLSASEPQGVELTREILAECSALNQYIEKGEIPNRSGSNLNDSMCRWCEFKCECWG